MNMTMTNSFQSLEQCLKKPDSIKTERQMAKQLNSLSGGLAELTYHHGVPRAQLIHESVKGYLINHGFQTLDCHTLLSSNTVIGESNAMLSRACIRYLSMDEIMTRDQKATKNIEEQPPFLEYSTMSWIHHTEQSEALEVSQEYILTSFHWPSEEIISSWVQIAMKQNYKDWPVPKTSLLHVTARYGFTSAVTAQLLVPSVVCRAILLPVVKSWFFPLPVTTSLIKMLQRYTYVGVEVDCKDNLGRTPLSWAAGRGHEAIVQLLLLREDVEINSTDNRGRTPLSWAAAAGHEGVVKLLLSRQHIHINATDSQGRTPLLWAVATNPNEAVTLQLLQKQAAGIVAIDSTGATALHIASRRGHESLTRLLLEHGAKIEAKDAQGRTALHEAALYGHKFIVQLLLLNGANVAVIDNGGDTCCKSYHHTKKGSLFGVVVRFATVMSPDLFT
jgi:ankyrin repeat protein